MTCLSNDRTLIFKDSDHFLAEVTGWAELLKMVTSSNPPSPDDGGHHNARVKDERHCRVCEDLQDQDAGQGDGDRHQEDGDIDSRCEVHFLPP